MSYEPYILRYWFHTNDAVKKARDDFEGLVKYWAAKYPIKNFYFTYNDKYHGSITFFVNDNPIKVATVTNPYNQALTPTFEIRTSTTGAAGAEKMEIDYIKIMQER